MKLGGGEEEHPHRKQHEQPHLPGLQQALGQVAVGRPGVGGVFLPVDQAVGGHGQGTCRRHGHRYPDELGEGGQPVRRQQHAHVGERQGEQGVLEADGFNEEVGFMSNHCRYSYGALHSFTRY